MKKRDTSKIVFYILVILLFAAGILSLLYRHHVDHQPWLPGETATVWNLEGKVEFDADQVSPQTIRLTLPSDQDGYKVLDQSTASSGYGLAYITGTKGQPIAEWTKREASGRQTLYYKVRVAAVPDFKAEKEDSIPSVPRLTWNSSEAAAASAIHNSVYSISSNRESYVRELAAIFRKPAGADQNLQLLRSYYSDDALLFTRLVNQAEIPAHRVNGLFLEDARRNQSLVKFLKVYLEDGSTQYFDLSSFREGLPDNFIIWNDHSANSLDVFGGKNSRINFSMIRQRTQVADIFRPENKEMSLLSFSIYELPLAEQSIFRTMLLIPLGVLVVVILRILVGVRTSGTFMPVLLAMAFMETSLITGLLGFLLVVGTGLVIRSYLSRLNLLLVARISAVIITVICIITIFTVTSYKIGLTEGLKITYFPIIILSWTIERMSILWEEEGAKEVVIQGGSSLLVATLVFLVITNTVIRYLVFNFLGLQLIIMAVTLVLGSYTGYRLSELRRFSPLVEDDNL
ncbi:MAG: inactive transglutaminase family protein [Spirochaetales bacterium]|nr:inactive transglutaminase family protein [Spirochaetales bacterium]